jgi:hypothetical protein
VLDGWSPLKPAELPDYEDSDEQLEKEKEVKPEPVIPKMEVFQCAACPNLHDVYDSSTPAP